MTLKNKLEVVMDDILHVLLDMRDAELSVDEALELIEDILIEHYYDDIN